MDFSRSQYVRPVRKIRRDYKANPSLFQPKIVSKTKRVLQYMKLCADPLLDTNSREKPFQSTRYTEAFIYNQGIYEQLRKKLPQRDSLSLTEVFPFEKLALSQNAHSSKFAQAVKKGIQQEDRRITQIKGGRRPQTAVKYQPKRWEEARPEEWRPQLGKIFCQGMGVGSPGAAVRPPSRYSLTTSIPKNIEYFDDL